MAWSSNATFLVNASLDDIEVPAVYKPQRGERPLWDFPEGTLCNREVAAYELSEALGWSIVPETVLRDGPYGVGMVQRFIDHDPDDHYFTLLEAHPDDFQRFAAFDVLANNADRKGGHCLQAKRDGHIWGIDHGLTFHVVDKLRTVIWDFAGEPVPEGIVSTLECILTELDGAARPPARRAPRARRGRSHRRPHPRAAARRAGTPSPTRATTPSPGPSSNALAMDRGRR